MKGVELAGEVDPGSGRALHTGEESGCNTALLARKQSSGYARLPRQVEGWSPPAPLDQMIRLELVYE